MPVVALLWSLLQMSGFTFRRGDNPWPRIDGLDEVKPIPVQWVEILLRGQEN